MQVTTVVGTRPEIIKLSRVIAALDESVEHTIIHTGQNHDPLLNHIFFEELKLHKPDHFLDATFIRPGVTTATTIETISNAMVRLDSLFCMTKPDALLILGDTNSCIAAAYVAKRKKIPLFHMEAGNRCFDERVPEEINRRIIDHISDINLPYSSIARENLLREGLPSDRIIKTGSPMNEVLEYYSDCIFNSTILSKLNLKPCEYFLVSCHREENTDSPEQLKRFLDLLSTLADKFSQRIIVSTHPRTEARLKLKSKTDLYDIIGFQSVLDSKIEFHKPFGLFDYVNLEQHAHCTLSDSGTITEESSILGFPALNLRETHERLEGMEEAAVIMTGFDVQKVMESIPLTASVMHTPVDYLANDVSNKVVRIILSYTDYVNRIVWGKHV
jgi:UDP-N-acetylglucosamine 2-epimerase (non-hydrolysing)